jgi:hypothetical protein
LTSPGTNLTLSPSAILRRLASSSFCPVEPCVLDESVGGDLELRLRRGRDNVKLGSTSMFHSLQAVSTDRLPKGVIRPGDVLSGSCVGGAEHLWLDGGVSLEVALTLSSVVSDEADAPSSTGVFSCCQRVMAAATVFPNFRGVFLLRVSCGGRGEPWRAVESKTYG